MKKQETKISSLNGPPVDFSFKGFRTLNQLLEETKEKKLAPTYQDQIKQDQKKSTIQHQNGEEEVVQNVNSHHPHETKLQIIRTIEISQTKILDTNKNASKKKQKNQKKLFKIVETKSSALFLRYNKFRSIEGLFGIAERVFGDLKNLIWIDLSFNRLILLVDDFKQFPNLKNLYLHSNYISDFKQIDKLAGVSELRSLTIHANPLEKYQYFRVLITCIIPQLHKIDSTLLTKREKERALIIKNQLKKYPIIKNPPNRPDESDNDEEF